MLFSELHQKLAFTYIHRLSIVYPNALNGNLLSYLFSDEFTGNTLTATFQDGVVTIEETVDGKTTTHSSSHDFDQIQKLVHGYYFDKRAATA